MISIISMLSSPNDESPANVDAAKEWREDRVSGVILSGFNQQGVVQVLQFKFKLQ